MPSEITMPQLSDTMTEGTLVKWHKKEGDAVKAGEEIADVETDKATMPMEAFDSGTLAAVLVGEGQKVKVGDRLAIIALEGEDAQAIRQSAPSSQPARETGGATKTVEPSAVETPPAAQVQAAAIQGGGRVRISPLARKIAAERGVDPSQLRGTGPGGRIVQRDVEAAASPAARAPAGAPQAAPRVAAGKTEVVALTKMRAAIAAALLRSKQTIPHFYETIDIDAEAITQLRTWLNKGLEAQGVKLSIADFVARAVALALLRHPEVNATFNGAEITRYGDVNLGIAVAVPDGLIVPVLRGAGPMGLRDIRSRSADLVDRARKGRLKQEEMTGATFTITNLGQYGVREFSAIINPPQVAILAVGAVEKRPVVRGDAVVPRSMLTVTLSADHRVVDGAVAAEFLRTLKGLIEEPGELVL